MKHDINSIIELMAKGNTQVLSKAISIVENREEGAEEVLNGLNGKALSPVIGITGPPGAGKSTLTNGIITELLALDTGETKGIGVLSIDPSSPFHQGAILGDRIRMSRHFNNGKVFIRSLATRGALGGLSVNATEICRLMQAFGFGYVIIETAGIGQSEVEIAGIADLVVVVLTPDSGDEIQVMKSGIMEIADIFALNKSDSVNTGVYEHYIQQMLSMRERGMKNPPIIKTVATTGEGVGELVRVMEEIIQKNVLPGRKGYAI